MPQLMMGPGNPTAVAIEVAGLTYLAAAPPAMLAQSTPMMRGLILGCVYYAYNTIVVPQWFGGVDPVDRVTGNAY